MNVFKGYMYDIGRGAFLRPATFEQAIRCAAEAGFTHFIPYLETMIRLPAMERACPACAYGEHEWRRFDAVAAACGIELVPHFNVIGHTREICAAYPELAGAAQAHEMDPTLPASRAWTLACLRQFCAFAAGRHFLIGGDEWQTPDHLLRRPGFDVARAWADQINLAVDCLAAQDRVPIVWHDMLLHYPAAFDRLDPRAVVAFWFYDDDVDYPILARLKTKFTTIMASGMTSGNFTRRRLRAMRTGLAAMERHGIDRFMMTSWSDGRWEKQRMNLALVGRLLEGQEPPDAICGALSIRDLLDLAEPGGAWAASLQADLDRRLADAAWDEFPEARRLLAWELAGDWDAVRASFERHHQTEPGRALAEGPLWGARRPPARTVPTSTVPANEPDRFTVQERRDPDLGVVLTVINGAEQFEVLPDIGVSLRNWRVDGETVIPGPPTGNLPPPGGYRGYTRVLGFRPILALGAHSNPCILWQHPWRWRLESDGADRQRLVFELALGHADFRYTIELNRGAAGFTFTAEALFKRPFIASWNFNLPLVCSPDEYETADLAWEGPAGRGVRRFRELDDPFASLEAARGCTDFAIRKPALTVQIGTEPGQVGAYYVSVMRTLITPDLHGIPVAVAAGGRLAARWSLRAETVTARDRAGRRP